MQVRTAPMTTWNQKGSTVPGIAADSISIIEHSRSSTGERFNELNLDPYYTDLAHTKP